MGIDSNWSLADRVGRLQDIHQGSPLMHEERQRKAAYIGDQFRTHVDQVVKYSPPTIAELKANLGQEPLTSTNLFTI